MDKLMAGIAFKVKTFIKVIGIIKDIIDIMVKPQIIIIIITLACQHPYL